MPCSPVYPVYPITFRIMFDGDLINVIINDSKYHRDGICRMRKDSVETRSAYVRFLSASPSPVIDQERVSPCRFKRSQCFSRLSLTFLPSNILQEPFAVDGRFHDTTRHDATLQRLIMHFRWNEWNDSYNKSPKSSKKKERKKGIKWNLKTRTFL